MKKYGLFLHRAIASERRHLAQAAHWMPPQALLPMRAALALAEAATPFVLPARGELIHHCREDENCNLYHQNAPQLSEAAFNLPANPISLEYVWPGSDSAKRVLVCVQGPQGIAVFVYHERDGEWNLACGQGFLARDPLGAPQWSARAICPEFERGLSFEEIANDVIGEVSVLWWFLAALACVGVSTPSVSVKGAVLPEIASNEYRVVRVGGDPAPRRANPSSERAVGSYRAGARKHFRRGHVRKLDADRFTWVRPTIVKPDAVWEVRKHYSAQGAAA